MLATLSDGGPKGGRWFSLIDKVYAPGNLASAWTKVRRNKGAAGVDGQRVENFRAHQETYLQEVATALREGTYRPLPVRRHWIDKPGTNKKRPLGIPVVKDRIVQGALRHVLEPLWEARFVEHSHGFRPGRSCHGALKRVEQLLNGGYPVVVDADIKSYFDTIPKDLLIQEIEEVVTDGRVIDLLRGFLDNSVMEGMKEWTPIAGTPQGAVISPLLANIYLHPVDVRMRDAGFEMVRYADDFVVLCRSREEAEKALELLRTVMTERKLELHPEKTGIVDTREKGHGFDFLGYRFLDGYKRPRKKSMKALKDKIRKLTPRKSGRSLQMIAAELNPILRGWFAYFRHCTRYVFSDLDGWIRRRLRSILRRFRRLKGTSKAKGRDHQRWTNAYFEEVVGLHSMYAAWQAFRESRCG